MHDFLQLSLSYKILKSSYMLWPKNTTQQDAVKFHWPSAAVVIFEYLDMHRMPEQAAGHNLIITISQTLVINVGWKRFACRAAVVTQLAERSLPIPEDSGSNPYIGNLY